MSGQVEFGISCNRYFAVFLHNQFIRISSATGSTAAMHAAGGTIMDIRSRKLVILTIFEKFSDNLAF